RRARDTRDLVALPAVAAGGTATARALRGMTGAPAGWDEGAARAAGGAGPASSGWGRGPGAAGGGGGVGRGGGPPAGGRGGVGAAAGWSVGWGTRRAGRSWSRAIATDSPTPSRSSPSSRASAARS